MSRWTGLLHLHKVIDGVIKKKVIDRIRLSAAVRILRIQLKLHLPGHNNIIYNVYDKVKLLVNSEEHNETDYKKLRSLLNQFPEPARGAVWLESSITLDGAVHRYAQRTLTHLIRLRDLYAQSGDYERYEAFWRRFSEVLYPYTLSDHGYNKSIDSRAASSVWLEVINISSSLSSSGYQCFINSGTLLGVVRNGKLIAHDDDVDLAVILHGSTNEDVAEEWRSLRERLQNNLSVNQELVLDDDIQYQIVCDGELTVDLFPCWMREGKVYIYPHTFGEGAETDLLPLRSVDVSGHAVEMPRAPAIFLALNYGAGWEKPDPAFRFDWKTANDKFSEFISRFATDAKE